MKSKGKEWSPIIVDDFIPGADLGAFVNSKSPNKSTTAIKA